MKIKNTLTLALVLLFQLAISQTILKADGAGNTYELINSALAPGYDVVEEPDCNHQSFGRHIDELFDNELNKYVFRFHMHTSPDNDRCINFDRQRNEIKTYDKSPDSLLGTDNELVEYRWKFKLDNAFQPSTSFTHLHQLKAVGGSLSSMPYITLTARKANPNRLELRYADALSQSTILQTPLAPLQGIWIEARELILYKESGLGHYEIHLTNALNGDTLLSYTDNSIITWKAGASFIRPKWGIYRSLNDSSSLRDEQVLFADFSIEELNPADLSNKKGLSTRAFQLFPNPVSNTLAISNENPNEEIIVKIYDLQGQLIMHEKAETNSISVSHLQKGFYIIALDFNGIEGQQTNMFVKN